MRMNVKGAAAALLLAAAVAMAGCFRYVKGLGKTIPNVTEAAWDSVELRLVLIGDAGR